VISFPLASRFLLFSMSDSIGRQCGRSKYKYKLSEKERGEGGKGKERARDMNVREGVLDF